jgi:hypothetical protein
MLYIFLKSVRKRKLRWRTIPTDIKLSRFSSLFSSKSMYRAGRSKFGGRLFRSKCGIPNKTFISLDLFRV